MTRGKLKKTLLAISLLAFLVVPFVGFAETDLSSGDYLIYRGHKRIEIFDLDSESVIASYNLDDIYSGEDYWYYNLGFGSGVVSDDFIYYGFDDDKDFLMAVNLESGESYAINEVDLEPDIEANPTAGISAIESSIVVPFYRSGACGYQYYDSESLIPSSVDYYRLNSSYTTNNVRRYGDYLYLFSWNSGDMRIHRVDPSTHVLDRLITTDDTSNYRGSTLTPEGYLAVVDALRYLRIYDYSQDLGSEMIFSGQLAGTPSDTAGVPLWFYGDTYDDGFYFYSPDSQRIYDYSIVLGSLSLNWQSGQFGGDIWGEMFDPAVTGDYIYTINYTGSARSTLRRHFKSDGSLDDTFSVLTYEGLDANDSGFYYPIRIGEISGEPSMISASLLPLDGSTITNDDIITITWENLESEALGFELKISQSDKPERSFSYLVYANFAYAQWSGLETSCYSYAPEPYTGYSFYGECSFPLSSLSPIIGSVEGSIEGIDYDVQVNAVFYEESDLPLITGWSWSVVGDEWTPADWEEVNIFPDYEFQSFADYYDIFGDYDDPAPMISSIGDMFSGTLGQVASITSTFQNRFNRSDASSIGRSATAGIATIRGYINSFGIFFGGFPIGMFLMTWLAVHAGVVLWRLIKWIISLIPTIG